MLQISASLSERMLGRAGADGGGTGGAKGSCAAPRQPAEASLEERCCLASIEQEHHHEAPSQSRSSEPREAGACFISATYFTLSWTIHRMMPCQSKVPICDRWCLQEIADLLSFKNMQCLSPQALIDPYYPSRCPSCTCQCSRLYEAISDT